MAVDPGANKPSRQPVWLALLASLAGALLTGLFGWLRRQNRARLEVAADQRGAQAPGAELAREALAPGGSAVPGVSVQGQKSTLAVAPTGNPAQAAPKGTQWSRTTKYVVGVGLFGAIVFLVYFSRQTIPLIIFAALLAFVARPFARFFERRLKLRQGWAVLAAYLLLLVLMAILPLFLLPGIVDAVNFITNLDLQAILEDAAGALAESAKNLRGAAVFGPLAAPALDALAGALGDLSSLETLEMPAYQISISDVGNRLSQAFGLLTGILEPVVSLLMSFVFMLLISVHVSLSTDLFREWYESLVPEAYKPELSGLIGRIVAIWGAFLRGQMLLMLIIGVIVWLGNLILGTEQALLLGFLSGVLELIPSLGPLIAAVPAVLLALIFGSSWMPVDPILFAVIVVLFYTLVQVIENQFIVPYVLGDAVDLPPLVVIIGVSIGGTTLGILGIFLATPVIATLREVFRYLYDKILEPPVVAELAPAAPSLMERLRGWLKRFRPVSRAKA
jgi:predicted PurR-regulated permease PerM